MTRARLIAWLAAGLLALPATPCFAQQRRTLFPASAGANAPARSAALRNPKRQQAPPPPRPDTIRMPYNLVWGDSQQRLASLFAGVGAQVANKKANAQTEVWTVQGLIAPHLQTSFFTFAQGMLIGLEFDYSEKDWDAAKYNDMMGQFRKMLESQCEKAGEIISRQTDQPPADAALKQSLMGYRWVRGDTMAELFYFSVEDTAKSLTYRTISVHYYYQDPYAAPADAPAPGATPAPGSSPSLFPAPAQKPLSPDTDHADPLPEK